MNVTLDAYINLKQKLESKMLISNIANTGNDNVLNACEQDLEYRKIKLQNLEDDVIYLDNLRRGVDITDLGLNDFNIVLNLRGSLDFVFFDLRKQLSLFASKEVNRLRVATASCRQFNRRVDLNLKLRRLKDEDGYCF